MADRPMTSLAMLDDDALGAALGQLGRGLATPDDTGLAAAVRARLDAGASSSRSWMDLLRPPAVAPSARSRRVALVLALVALAVTAAIVGARLLDLPGLRFIFDPGAVPSASPSPSLVAPSAGPSRPPGASLGLGDEVALADLDRLAGFDVVVPSDPDLGPPDAVYHDPDIGGGHVTLVWSAGDDLPPLIEGSDAGLIVTQFRGSLDEDYFTKIINSGNVFGTVSVGDSTGYWIDGGIHFFFYVGPDGRPVDDTRRLVGDVLAFERDGLTIRIETAAGLERALTIAESLE
jgi:hypothetical protein